MVTQIQNAKQNFSGLMSEGAGFIGGLLNQLWNSGKTLIDVISLLVVTPVVAFYILLDWDRMVEKVDSWVPRDQVHTIRQLAREMDDAVSGFIRGQGSLCLILGIYYAVGLSLVGLNFGLLIGFVAGMISFIPYIGSLVGLILAVGVALMQFWPDYGWIIATDPGSSYNNLCLNANQAGGTGAFLGVNTNNPQYTLDVNGNANIASNLTVGGSITTKAITWNRWVTTMSL